MGVIFGPRIPIPSPSASEQISTVAAANLEYWLNRYQTFLGGAGCRDRSVANS
jgi:hypothetical protein